MGRRDYDGFNLGDLSGRRPFVRRETRLCVHCGSEFPVEPGDTRRRTWCRRESCERVHEAKRRRRLARGGNA